MFRFVMGVACALMLFGCNGRPGSSSNIPIDGVGGNGGAGGGTHCALVCDGDDVCGVAGVEECCPACETCEDAYDAGYAAGYADGFADGVDSVVCQCPDWPPADVCALDPESPPGHLLKECRGRPDKD